MFKIHSFILQLLISQYEKQIQQLQGELKEVRSKADGKELQVIQEIYEQKIISLSQQIQDDDQRILDIAYKKVNLYAYYKCFIQYL